MVNESGLFREMSTIQGLISEVFADQETTDEVFLTQAEPLANYSPEAAPGDSFLLYTLPYNQYHEDAQFLLWFFTRSPFNGHEWLLEVNGGTWPVILHGASTPSGLNYDPNLIKKDVGLKFSIIGEVRWLDEDPTSLTRHWSQPPENLPKELQLRYRESGLIVGGETSPRWRVPIGSYLTPRVCNIDWRTGVSTASGAGGS